MLKSLRVPVSRRSLLVLPVLAAAPRLAAQSGPYMAPAGVTGDGSTLNTRAIQAAIDQCAAAGGGQVALPPGRYLTGTLRLRDRVTLVLEGGAVLLGSTRLDDYPVLRDAIPSYTSNYTERSLIRADGVSDVAIRGAGAIDGNGPAFAGPYKVRPYLMRFIGCRGVRVEGITLQNSAMWVQHYLDCEDILIDGIRVRSRRQSVNNDGIDIDSCRRVRIANCDIDCGDDAIVLKATTARPCRDVVVTNCVLSTLCNAFKLGTESNGGFDNIVFTNSAIYNTRLAGIALEMVDGGSLHRVGISNIVMRETACPIFLRLGNRARPVAEPDPRPGMGSFSGVTIRGVNAEAMTSVISSITGLPGHPIEDVLLEDIRLAVAGGGAAFAEDRQVPELPEAYPEGSMFGALPAYGLYCRHVRGLSLNRVAFRTATPDARPALTAEDVEGLSVSNLSGSVPPAASPLMDFRNIRRSRIRETQAAAATQPLLRLSGAGTRDIAVQSDQESDPTVLADPEVGATAWRWLR
jgi:polygalacturonase